jgi:23S rRNA (cytosine1962-C5)-methyltransferase
MASHSIIPVLEKALTSREALFDSRHESALRLFNGFTEGCADLAVDLYARTFVIHDYADDPVISKSFVQDTLNFLTTSLSLNWLRAGIVKSRNGKTQEEKRGQLVYGNTPDRKIKEYDVWYSIDLTMNRDASFYLDTRNLRKWLIENSSGKSVLNTFAYTGSLGVAALGGGASHVVQSDRNHQFLNLAKDSYSLNGFPISKQDFVTGDFFTQIGKYKRTGELFDIVIVDPPFFSTTPKGKVDQEKESGRLINKVRPLVKNGGYLIAINNALFVSGKEYMQTLESLCRDGYLRIKELIPVPEDFTGYDKISQPITDPTPFNHSTKIAILEVSRRQD